MGCKLSSSYLRQSKNWETFELYDVYHVINKNYNILESEGGQKWLTTYNGREWLETKKGYEWLGTDNGQKWIHTNYIGTRYGDIEYWLNTSGKEWLRNMFWKNMIYADFGKKWFALNYKIYTGFGYVFDRDCVKSIDIWLNTKDGNDWLDTKDGHDWLDTEAGEKWLIYNKYEWAKKKYGSECHRYIQYANFAPNLFSKIKFADVKNHNILYHEYFINYMNKNCRDIFRNSNYFEELSQAYNLIYRLYCSLNSNFLFQSNEYIDWIIYISFDEKTLNWKKSPLFQNLTTSQIWLDIISSDKFNNRLLKEKYNIFFTQYFCNFLLSNVGTTFLTTPSGKTFLHIADAFAKNDKYSDWLCSPDGQHLLHNGAIDKLLKFTNNDALNDKNIVEGVVVEFA